MTGGSSSIDAVHVRQAIDALSLDLRGLTVLTEAATGAFCVTPVIAAAAGARRVYAVARDSAYGTSAEAERAVRAFAQACGAPDVIVIVHATDGPWMADVDVVTNLGFVRPISAELVSRLNATAVVAVMCEAWEARPGDIDVEACRRAGVAVFGTNEHDPSWPVFTYCGILALRLLLDAGCPVFRSRVAVIGDDVFGPTIVAALRALGADVRSAASGDREGCLASIAGADAIVLAEYRATHTILGADGVLTPRDLTRLAPVALVVQLAGGIEASSLQEANIAVWPSPVVPPRRMSRTLAALGARPVIELHAAGLKGAEVIARLRREGLDAGAAVAEGARRFPLIQEVPS